MWWLSIVDRTKPVGSQLYGIFLIRCDHFRSAIAALQDAGGLPDHAEIEGFRLIDGRTSASPNIHDHLVGRLLEPEIAKPLRFDDEVLVVDFELMQFCSGSSKVEPLGHS